MQIRTIGGGYSESFKIHVVQEVESGKLSPSEANRKYNILGHSTIMKWCRKYGSTSSGKSSTTIKKAFYYMNKEDYEILRLKNEIESLKTELEDSRLKNVVLETMVDIAEKELEIPIRKKYGAKQSGK